MEEPKINQLRKLCAESNLDFDSLSQDNKSSLLRAEEPKAVIDEIILGNLNYRIVTETECLLIPDNNKDDYIIAYKSFPSKEAFESIDIGSFALYPRQTLLTYLDDYNIVLRDVFDQGDKLPENISDFFYSPNYKPGYVKLCRYFWPFVKAVSSLNNQALSKEDISLILEDPEGAVAQLNAKNSTGNRRFFLRKAVDPEIFYGGLLFEN